MRMKNSVNKFMMVAAALSLVACSDTVVSEPENGNGTEEIRLKSTIIRDLGVVSRTPYEGTTATLDEKPLTARILTSLDATSYASANVHCNGTMTFELADTEVAYNKPMDKGTGVYPTGAITTPVYLSGLYPTANWDLATSAGDAIFTITGKDDIMFAPRVESSSQAAAAGTFPELAFTHQLTWLKLKVTGDTQATNPDRPIKVTDIKLVKALGAALQDKATVKLSAASQTVEFAESASPVASISCYVKTTADPAYTDDVFTAQEYTVTATATEVAYVMAPPVTATAATDPASFEYTFAVTYEDGSIENTVDVTIDLKDTGGTNRFAGDTTGKSFEITFNFIGGKIFGTATVTAWEAAGVAGEDI